MESLLADLDRNRCFEYLGGTAADILCQFNWSFPFGFAQPGHSFLQTLETGIVENFTGVVIDSLSGGVADGDQVAMIAVDNEADSRKARQKGFSFSAPDQIEGVESRFSDVIALVMCDPAGQVDGIRVRNMDNSTLRLSSEPQKQRNGCKSQGATADKISENVSFVPGLPPKFKLRVSTLHSRLCVTGHPLEFDHHQMRRAGNNQY